MKAFFEAHGASRFENVDGGNDQRIISRAGFVRIATDGSRTYMVLSQAFKNELCKGFDQKTVVRVLRDAGWLALGTDGRSTQKPRLPGIGPTRCYVFTARIWEGEP